MRAAPPAAAVAIAWTAATLPAWTAADGQVIVHEHADDPSTLVIHLPAAEVGHPDVAAGITRALDDESPDYPRVLVRFDATDRPWAIRHAIRIGRDGVTIDGRGATLRFADRAMNGDIIDCIEVVGTPDDPVEGFVLRDITIDANYWNQPGSHNPRGFDSDHAVGILLENVHITNAFVGMTFGRGVIDSEARDCRVTRWYDDAFGVSGDGASGSARHNRFVRCVAEDSPNEIDGGPPGNRNNAWEIEDGAHGTVLIDCAVRNCGGNGFAVRNHGWPHPVTTSDTTFIRCVAENVGGYAWHVFGQAWPVAVEGVRLENCRTDSVAAFWRDARDIEIVGSAFGAHVSFGPVRRVRVSNTAFDRVRVFAEPVGVPASRGHYRTSVTFDGCTFGFPVSVYGERGLVEIR